jgi:TetR/AcrR family transcriptional repressor of nem operon
VAAARRTVYVQGAERTTIADVASAADVPLGNVYYYFKTKDALMSAVVGSYRADFAALIDGIEQRRTPRARLKALIGRLAEGHELLTDHGCPIGSLNAELGKRGDSLQAEAAEVLRDLVEWSSRQFVEMGRPDAHELGVALIAAYEGVTLIAHALRQPNLIKAESRRLSRWIDELADLAPKTA